MKKSIFIPLALSLIACVFTPVLALAEASYEVKVTNLTQGITFAPVLVASTREGDAYFAAGEVASPELEALAETGDSEPLAATLDAFDVTSLGFIEPGASDSVVIETTAQYQAVFVASMLTPSNDAFFAANSVEGPHGNKTISFTLPAWDAGTELNDELCINLPGPGCDEDPGPESDNGEGYIYISNGIRGVGDLDADVLDWKNPVALVTVTRLGDENGIGNGNGNGG